MSEQVRIQKLAEKLSNLHLQPEVQKQSRIDSSETKFRQLETRFEEFVEFSEKRMAIIREQVGKLEKTAAEEKRLFNDSLQEKLKTLTNMESQFALLIDAEIKVR